MNKVSKKCNVIILVGSFYPEVTGGTIHCKYLIDSLKNKINFKIITTSKDFNLKSNDNYNNIPVKRIKYNPKKKFSKFSAIFKFIIILLKWYDYDIIHFHGFSQKNIIPIIFCLLFRKKTILSLHSLGDNFSLSDDPISIRKKSLIQWFFYNKIDRYIGTNLGFKRRFLESNLSLKKYIFISNFTDVDKFTPTSEDNKIKIKKKYNFNLKYPIIIFVGFFGPEKRPDYLYKAWYSAYKKNAISQLLFIGKTKSDHPEVDENIYNLIKQSIKKDKLENFVKFIETVEEINENIENFYRISDLFVLPSLREGCPNALLESMSTEIPSIITNLPGITDYIIENNNNGFLIEKNNIDQLSNLLVKLIKDKNLRKTIGKNARHKIINNFSINTISQLIHKEYTNIL